ncbi:diguanylate cyclase (GGDEF)-like protein [Rhodoblastus acidophilus]|uniref:putative bifunctional diguanylate cyclase/phosphodiesterase n=1 Tax=Rhodoblastus acidophilus TaxID=1074 RepID=UPI00222575DA|nr:EAL domain-containing protein [Rhodoblastus acidophilus]MCW2285054.1 diguanylate cyclase (GGDEF)-like protein [Rhodoblastus acidophilus]MCW2334088.1 diguanylate cyclase (GGDEF)-like protein [Rhodoblastus acidophilus]
MSEITTRLSLKAVEAEARADPFIYRRALKAFIEREKTNTYLAKLAFGLAAVVSASLDMTSIFLVTVAHLVADFAASRSVARLASSCESGAPDQGLLRRVEAIYYGVGFSLAMATWPLAEALDGFRLLLTVVSVAGLLAAANTTCFAPRIFRSMVTGFALAIATAMPFMTTMPWFAFGGAFAVFITAIVATGVGTARQFVQMLRLQNERDKAIQGQRRTIAALESARKNATELARTDGLTGLPNRSAIMKKLDELISSKAEFSLTLLDVDLFKNINDALGHNVGDAVLASVGRALAILASENCFSARLGGDEFALISVQAHRHPSANQVFSAVKAALRNIQRRNSDLPLISITGGSASFPRDAADRSGLLAAADLAQREAKKTRRGGHRPYDVSFADAFERETQIVRALGEAIASGELSLSFQPKIDLRSGRVAGAEALTRFSGKILASYGLDEIFAAAGNRGFGMSLDELVLDRYREALLELRDRFALSLPTSVNLSGAILKAPERLLAKLKLMIGEGLEPSLIRLEITEDAIYGRGQIGVIELLDEIARLGFSLSLDDFGTGSGALSHLTTISVAEIKIDRSFVCGMDADLTHRALVSGLIVIGREMGVDIVAEGVETEAEAEQLRAMGAQFGQGFLWSRALPVSQFVEFVRMFGPGRAPAVGQERKRS